MSASLSETSEAVAYVHRPRPFGPAIAYRLEARGLAVDTGRKTELIPYARIVQARLAYAPNSFLWDSYRTKLTLTDGRTLAFANFSLRGHVQTERHDEAYRAFVVALLARVKQANPRLLCVAGRPAALWALTALAGALMLSGLLAVTVAALRQGSWGGVLLSVFILGPFALLTARMIVRNWPRPFEALSPPDAVMPAPPRARGTSFAK